MREALDYSYDFEKINLYNQRRRTYSLFSNSDFAAKGLPGPGELALLEPFRGKLPPEVFGEPYQPPRTDTGPNALRENLKKARALLEEAGWKVAPTAFCATPRASPSSSSISSPEPNQFRTVDLAAQPRQARHQRSRSRIVDFALYRKRLETFDFDTDHDPHARLRAAATLSTTRIRSARKAADEPGSNNFRGLKNPAVDAMIARDERARRPTRSCATRRARSTASSCSATTRCRSSTRRRTRSRTGTSSASPKSTPKYYAIDESTDWPAWAVTAWWSKDAEAR